MVSRARALRMYCAYAAGIGIVSFALLSPALRGTLMIDDWDHYAMQRHMYPVEVASWDMFRFVGSSISEKRPLLDSGRLPWWSSSNLHLAVFRPLSSLLIYVDLAWFAGKDHPWWMHLHSLLWWFVLLCAVAALYRRLLAFPAAVFSLLVFAVDDAHVYPVVWIANRSEIVAVSLVCWGIWAHIAAETHPRPLRFRVMAAVLVALGLLAGEHAIAPLSYLALFELGRGWQRWPQAARRLLPYLALTLAYSVWRAVLGYGVAGSAYYVDPIGEPIRYWKMAAVRIPLLAADLTFSVAADWWSWGNPYVDLLQHFLPTELTDEARLAELQLGLGVTTLLAWIVGLAWGYRISSKSGRGRTRWALLLGAPLSLIPLAGTVAMSRLTVVPAIAFDAVIGTGIWWLIKRTIWSVRSWKQIMLAVVTVFVAWLHVERPAAFSLDGARYLANLSHLEYGWTTKAKLGPRVAHQHVFVVSAPDVATQYLVPYILHAADLPAPLTMHLLSPAAYNSHVLTRIGSNVLDVQFPEPITKPVFAPMVYRQGGAGFFPGQTFRNSLFEVEVKSVRGTEPRHLRFTFVMPLDDPDYLFMYPTDAGIEPIDLPPLGVSVRLEPPAWPR